MWESQGDTITRGYFTFFPQFFFSDFFFFWRIQLYIFVNVLVDFFYFQELNTFTSIVFVLNIAKS